MTTAQRVAGHFLSATGVLAICAWVVTVAPLSMAACFVWTEGETSTLFATLGSRREMIWGAVELCAPPCAAGLSVFGEFLCGRFQQTVAGSVKRRMMLEIGTRTLMLYTTPLAFAGLLLVFISPEKWFGWAVTAAGVLTATGAVACHLAIRRMLRAGKASGPTPESISFPN